MFIDHSGKVIFANNQDMRLLGRIAFPIYIWCMIVGLERTRIRNTFGSAGGFFPP